MGIADSRSDCAKPRGQSREPEPERNRASRYSPVEVVPVVVDVPPEVDVEPVPEVDVDEDPVVPPEDDVEVFDVPEFNVEVPVFAVDPEVDEVPEVPEAPDVPVDAEPLFVVASVDPDAVLPDVVPLVEVDVPLSSEVLVEVPSRSVAPKPLCDCAPDAELEDESDWVLVAIVDVIGAVLVPTPSPSVATVMATAQRATAIRAETTDTRMTLRWVDIEPFADLALAPRANRADLVFVAPPVGVDAPARLPAATPTPSPRLSSARV